MKTWDEFKKSITFLTEEEKQEIEERASMDSREQRDAVARAKERLRDMGDEALLAVYTDLVQWHTRREYSRDTDPKTDEKRTELWAAEQVLLQRLQGGQEA